MNIQKLILLGRATKDAEAVQEKFIAFSVAVNRYVGKPKTKDREQEVTFYECLSFGKEVSKRAALIKKGDLIVVEGRPEVEAYLSKEGEAKATLKVLVDDWQVLK